MRSQKGLYRSELESAKPIIDYFVRKRKRKRENSLKNFVMSSCYVSCIMYTTKTKRCFVRPKHRILWHWGL